MKQLAVTDSAVLLLCHMDFHLFHCKVSFMALLRSLELSLVCVFIRKHSLFVCALFIYVTYNLYLLSRMYANKRIEKVMLKC